MMYLLADGQPLMFIMLTKQDVQTMRPGRTVFLDLAQQSIKAFKVEKVVLSLHKDAAAIHDTIRQAGHGHKLQEVAPAPHAESDETACASCGGINKTWMLLHGKCIVCWHKAATKNVADNN